MLVSRIGRIEAPGAIRIQYKPRRGCLTQRVGLSVTMINIRGRHLTRNRRAILGRTCRCGA